MNRTAAPSGRVRSANGAPRGRAAQSAGPIPSESAATRWSFFLKSSIILVVLVFVGRAHEVIPGVPPLPIGNVVVLAAASALALGGYLRRLPLLYGTPQLRFVFLLLLIAFATIPFALWPGGATSTWISAAKLWTICILIPLATVTTRQLSLVTKTFALASALLVAGYVLENLGVSNFTARQSLGFDRNDVALFAVMGIPYALAWAAPSAKGRSFGVGLAGFLVVGIIATGSRGGFLAMGIVGTAFLLRSKLLSWPKKVLILAAALSLSLFVGSGDYWQRIGVVFSDPTEDYNFQAREGRIEIWKRGIGYAKEHPLTGVGIGNFAVAEGATLENLGYGVKWSTAHNAYILALVELGVPGLLVFLALLVSIYREADVVSKLGSRNRGPPVLHRGDALLPALGDATKLSLLGYIVAAVFLSVTYNVAFLFLVSVTAVQHLIRKRAVARAAALARGPLRGSRKPRPRRS